MLLIEFAHSNGIAATKKLSREEQKALGQFMTPPSVAHFMAQRCLPPEDLRVVRILDPAAGVGILSAAVIENLLNRPQLPDQIDLTLYEMDGRLVPFLRRLVGRMRHMAQNRGVVLTASIRCCDFLLSSVAITRQPVADIIIANPPYFKINAADSRALAHPYAVYGQPNIYGLFMAVCAGLLSPSGRWCFITPRSWTNGLYFTAVRRHLFHWLQIDAMHVFESRQDHFTDDKVLQEAMITWATAPTLQNAEIVVSSSEGSHDLAQTHLLRLPAHRVISQDNEQMIALPTNTQTEDLPQWNGTLSTLGLKVSTGPVVAFRAGKYIKKKTTTNSVPLLWMQHIDHMRVRWPINRKYEHIKSNVATAWMLVPNANYVIMRRFSPKEDKRRITAAPYLAGTLPGAMLGLENHTNYVYRPSGEMTSEETCGLAAYLNSQLVDTYLRSVAGNTQVNATDLRKLPLPTKDILIAIGRAVPQHATLVQIDRAVNVALGIGQPDILEIAVSSHA